MTNLRFPFTPEAEEFLREIARSVVVIGGAAEVAHGMKATTKDLDVLCNPRHEDKLRDVIRARKLPFDSAFIGTWSFSSDTIGFPVEILPIHYGDAPYSSLRRRAVPVDINGVEMLCASADDI